MAEVLVEVRLVAAPVVGALAASLVVEAGEGAGAESVGTSACWRTLPNLLRPTARDRTQPKKAPLQAFWSTTYGNAMKY